MAVLCLEAQGRIIHLISSCPEGEKHETKQLELSDKKIGFKAYVHLGTLKLSIRDVLPDAFTLLLAQSRISASEISFPWAPWEWNLSLFNSWSILNLINCHRSAEKTPENLSYMMLQTRY